MPRRSSPALIALVLFLAAAAPAAAQQGSLSAVQVGQLTARAGEQFSGTVATFSHAQDPDPSHFTATILWGDGSSSAGVIACRNCQGQPPQFEVRGTHTWAGAGDYPVSVTVTYPPDQATSTGQGSAHVVTQDQQPPPTQTPPEATPPAGPPVPEGRPFSATAHEPFTGVVAAVPAGTPVKLIVIDWGDGTKSAGAADGDGNISGSHTFAKAGLHQVTTTVTGPLGSSVASSNARVNLPDPPRECVTKVAFAKLSAVGTCILKIDDNTWETKGDLRVRVNGIDIEPVGTARIRFLKKSLRLTSIGKVIVRAGPVTLYTGVLKLDAQADIPGGFNVSVKAEIAGFPIEGGVAVRFKPDPTTADYGATLDVHLGLPALFGGFTGDVGLRLSNQDGLVLDKLRLEVASVYLGALHVQNLFVDYRRIGNEWRGGASLSLPSGVGLNASPPPPEQGVTFRDGKLISIGATLSFPSPGAVVASGVFLNSIGFQLGTSPSRFLGNAQFSTGSAGGRTLARINASMFIAFARPDEPFTAPVGVPAKPRTFTSTAFHVAGTVTLVDRFDLGGAYLLYVDPGYAELAGEFNYELLSGLVSAQARVSLAINTRLNQFNGEVGAEVCAAKVACVGGDMIISNVGIGACARTFLVDVGGGYFWGGKGFFMWRHCDVGRVRVAVSPARAAQAGDPSFTLPGGLDKAVIGVKGRDGAPVVTLIDPAGRRYTVPPGDEWVNRADLMAFKADEIDETFVAVPAPKAGSWRVETAAGSAPVTGVEFAETLPEPRVRARVTGRGRARAVAYDVRPVDGQRVLLFEKGRDTMRRIGEARGTKGRIRFTPSDGSGGRRQIVAEVRSFGSPRARLVAGTYTAPPPVRPAAVRRLRATARGSRVCATWRSARGAAQYAATFRLSDGRKQLVLTRHGRACVSHVVGPVTGRVAVRGVSARGRRGSETRVQLKR